MTGKQNEIQNYNHTCCRPGTLTIVSQVSYFSGPTNGIKVERKKSWEEASKSSDGVESVLTWTVSWNP